MDIGLIQDGPTPGAWNMAVDEALLEAVADARNGGWLRFYQWDQPTVSLGYFQCYADRRQHLPSIQCPLVRRSTGGGAIIHADELTYSCCLPVSSHSHERSRALYRAFHDTFIEELASRGIHARICGDMPQDPASEEPFLCFLRRAKEDVLLGGSKILGSAQRRRHRGLLQHGSVLLKSTECSPELRGLEDIAGIRLEPGELAVRWASRIADRLGVQLHPSVLGSAEAGRAERWREDRFQHEGWTRKR
jgi:lipoate-protein ligase A